MSEGALPELPGGWVWTRLEDACIELIGGGTPSREIPEYFGGNIIWLTPTEVPKNKIAILKDSKEKITESGLKDSSARIIPKDSVLLTSRASIGYVAIAGCDVTTNQGFASFVCSDAIYNFFLAYWLCANKQMLESNATGTTFKEISKSKLREFYIPLPPLPEQRRIVAKIEELFTKLDAGVSALKKTQAQLKRYRQSVLKSACEGKLVPTEAALAKADGRAYEPAKVLLARISKKRREKSKGAKYKEPAAPDTSGLPKLPEGWEYTSLDQLLTRILAGKSFKCEERVPNQNEIGVVKVSAVTWGEFDESESKTCMDSERINEDFLIKKGDFLFSRANTIELVGACVIVKQINKKLMLSDKILRFDFSVVTPQWVLINLRTSFGRSEIERLATGNQESMRNIGQDRIREIRIPLPPLAEQRRIVAEVERRLSVADEVARTVEQSLVQAQRLRQSILKKAFEGRLVAQNPEDEPAGVLLEKIRLQKQLEIKKGRSKR